MSWWFRNPYKILRPLLPGLSVGGLVAGLLLLGGWNPLENLAHGLLLNLRGARPWNDQLMVIGIDDQTLGQLGQFPLSRQYYAQLLTILSQSGSRVVAFDLLFAEPSPDDAALAAAMVEHGSVVLAQSWGSPTFKLEAEPQLLESAIASGHIDQSVDTDRLGQGIRISIDGVPAFSVAIAQAYSLVAELVAIPTDSKVLRLNWPGPPEQLTYASLVDVIQGHVSPAVFENKIVLVGGTATGLNQVPNPFNQSQTVDGIYIQAVALQNLLQRDWLRIPNQTLVVISLLIAGPLLSLLLQRCHFQLQLGIWLASSGGWMLICLLAIHHNYALPIVPPLILLSLTQGVIALNDRLRANALWQARGEFLNTMSHEVRTPLNAIVGVAEMLQETQLTAKQREFTDTIYNSSQTLLALINDVLDFSKIESGKLLLEKGPINIVSCIEQSLDIVAPRAEEKQIELVYCIDPATPPVVISDSVRLRQVLLNLLSNAVKFTEKGEVSLQVQAVPTEKISSNVSAKTLSAISRLNSKSSEADYTLKFLVRDTGIGISADQQKNLFKPFSQASAAIARQYGGTGLGLAISKRLIENLGGRVWVDSQVGKGSLFSFTIQVTPDPLANAQDLTHLANLWAGKQWLIIDKNSTRCTQLGSQLRALNLSLIFSRSIAEALGLIQQGQSFDGVILDAAITKTNNISAIQALRQSARGDTASSISLAFILMAALRENLGTKLPENTIVVWKPVKQSAIYRALMQIAEARFPNPEQIRSVPLPANVHQPKLTFPRSDRPLYSLPAAPPAQPIVHRKTLKVLIAEDNRINQRVAQHMVEMLGYEVSIVTNGMEVLTALKQADYDVILMDMRMPELDGVSATRQVRQLGQHIRQPWIIAMTANAISEDRARCIAAGMNDYVSKPIQRDILAQALSKCEPLT